MGHALEYVQADAYVRTQRLIGEDIFFLTGTDDNALKNVQAAEAAGKPTAKYIEENAKKFIDLDKSLSVKYDDFIRTSVDPRHRAGVEKLWRATNSQDIYKKSYRGFYCVGCEEFKTEKDLINGECPEHPGKPLEEVKEENYFFKLSAYQNQLYDLINSDTLVIVPESRKNEMLSFIKGGLEDFSVSRSAKRARGWGIPVPNDPDQYLYVWYDALANYVTALGYANRDVSYQKYWESSQKRVHIIGKGINRFHTIYWPAMLLSAGMPLPTTVFVHGYINSEGQKMSKLLGNVIDPFEYTEHYGTDAVRYYLLRHMHPFEDSDFTRERFEEAYTANLTNGLGNLVARVMKLSSQYLDETPKIPEIKQVIPEIQKYVDAFEFNQALDHLWFRIGYLDGLIQEQKPFEVIKTNKNTGQNQLTYLLTQLAEIGVLLEPFMPGTSKEIIDAVRANQKPENLFPRI